MDGLPGIRILLGVQTRRFSSQCRTIGDKGTAIARAIVNAGRGYQQRRAVEGDKIYVVGGSPTQSYAAASDSDRTEPQT